MGKLFDEAVFSLLNEGKLENLKAMYVSDDRRGRENKNKIPEHVFKELSEIDPTLKYLQWMIIRYLKEGSQGGSLERILAATVPEFEALVKDKKIRGTDANFEQFPTVETMVDAVNKAKGPSHSEAKRGVKDFSKDIDPNDVVFENDKCVVVQPKDTKSSIRYGRGSTWCTAADSSNNLFNSYYHDQGANLYYILVKDPNHPKYNAETLMNKFAAVMYPDGRTEGRDFEDNLLDLNSAQLERFYDDMGIPK